MTGKNQSQAPAVCNELEQQTHNLYGQGDSIGADIGIMAGRLGRKGKDAEADKVWQVFEDTSGKYVQKLEILKAELDFIEKDKRPGKYGYLTIIGDILLFLEEERTGDSHLPDRDKAAYYAKIKEMLTVVEERNQALSSFATKIRKKYSHIDSLPDVPVPNVPTALSDFKRTFVEAWEQYRANSPSDISSHCSVKKTTNKITLR